MLGIGLVSGQSKISALPKQQQFAEQSPQV